MCTELLNVTTLCSLSLSSGYDGPVAAALQQAASAGQLGGNLLQVLSFNAKNCLKGCGFCDGCGGQKVLSTMPAPELAVDPGLAPVKRPQNLLTNPRTCTDWMVLSRLFSTLRSIVYPLGLFTSRKIIKKNDMCEKIRYQ